MLRCLQPPKNFAGNCTDMSMLERQREMQRRLHQQQQRWKLPLSQPGELDQISPQFQSLGNGDALVQQKTLNWPITFDQIPPLFPNFGALCGGDSLGSSSSSAVVTKRSLEMDHNSFNSTSISSSPVMAPVAEAMASIEQKANMLSSRTRKKMKCLQDLVPGCNKVTGKAGMLEEIINYVQSLQRQVEFLSMKLAAVNPRQDFNHDNFIAKELPACMARFPPKATPSDMVNSAYFQCHEAQKEASTCGVDLPINLSQAMLQRTVASLWPIPELYFDSCGLPQIQQLSAQQTDLKNLYCVNLH